ncbi:integrase catalytic domain-containing protein [Trichonephila clavipes]|nr:integrase catalytic domain-containing protein [Trichonephila clavipes]
MKFLSIEVSSEDRIKLARNSFDSKKSNYKNKLGNLSTTATAADLFNSNFKNRKDFKFNNNNNNNCIFCEKAHASENCCEAASMLYEFKKNAVIKRGVCYICLKKGHMSHSCRSDVKCIICNKRQYAVLCSKLPLRSGLEIESASIENSTTASSFSSNVLANQACTSEVLLQTLVVMLQNGNHIRVYGRYEVALPWVLDNKLLSSNRKLAENRLESTKRKLIATGKFEEYQDVLDLWLSGKIIEEVNDDKENFVHYLPHRPVIKENCTSKIRPVFDASARTKGSPFLNDCLEKGPNFIEVIPTILNRFRKYKIGVISDIEKAFLQIGVREQDRDFLRFMWVKEIRNLSDVSSWEHVPSEKNFADILSRGCSAQQLVYLRWWEGPSWLSESPVQCPRSKQVPDEEAVNLELRKFVLVNTAKRIEEFNWHSQYFSSYLKVVRMIPWIFRFFKNAKRIDVCNTSEITFSEFDHAEKTVIKLIQMKKFEGVTDEKLRPLKPFLDEFGILRARTKFSFREDTHNFKFPIILPNEHPVVHLMIVRKHEELMHAGVSIVMNHLRESFWILKARKLIRQIIQKCTRCKRFSAQKTEVVPSSLPKDRWKFNPPSAAWWGGFWERMIQMLKQILRKMLGRASLYYEELNTVLCECEHVINSRPLTYISEDVNDLSPLTPAMFLQEIETSDVTDIDCLDYQEINKRGLDMFKPFGNSLGKYLELST